MLKEKIDGLLDELFKDWVNLGCDDYDEMENYDTDDPKDYARARMQEVADNIDAFVDNELDWYTEDTIILSADKSDVKELVKAKLKEDGYDVK